MATTVTAPSVTKFYLVEGTTNELYAAYEPNSKFKDHIDHYEVKWTPYNLNGDPISQSWQSVGLLKNSTYTIPENTLYVTFVVRAVSKQLTDSNKKKYWPWGSQYTQTSTVKKFDVGKAPGEVSTPSYTIDDELCTVSITGLGNDPLNTLHADKIRFLLFRASVVNGAITDDDESKASSSKNVDIVYGQASATFTLTKNVSYVLTARAYNSKTKTLGPRSDFTEVFMSGVMDVPVWSYKKNGKTIKLAPYAVTKQVIRVDWVGIAAATEYEIQWTDQTRFFDSSPENVQSKTVQKEAYQPDGDEYNLSHTELTGLETGKTWYIRVRAIDSTHGRDSGWSSVVSIVVGSTPSPPTTWSSTVSVVAGTEITLYWVHNTADGSAEKKAHIQVSTSNKFSSMIVDKEIVAKDKNTHYYKLDTSSMTNGNRLYWRVRTYGITEKYSDWSTVRELNVYSNPELYLSIKNSSGSETTSLTGYPFTLNMRTGTADNPSYISGQKPISYHFSIKTNKSYDTFDSSGNAVRIYKDAVIYDGYLNPDSDGTASITLSAGDIMLSNNGSYVFRGTVAMDSGIVDKSNISFTTAFAEDEYYPIAGIAIDPTNVNATIRPYCLDDDGNELDVNGLVKYSVYRIEPDNTLTPIVENFEPSTIVDPHPSLNNVRYRIIAVSKATGTISANDTDIPVDEHSLIIQWQESWESRGEYNPSEYFDEYEPYTSMMLKLPYNLDMSESHTVESESVNYIGRKYPVTYFGTARSTEVSFNADIPEYDTETLYLIRRLADWDDIVYVREPTGTGYYATVSVSFNKNHCELVIPISISVNRVEPGVTFLGKGGEVNA